MNQIDVTFLFIEMAEGVLCEVLCYQPAPRFAHVAAAVEGKLYVWGGRRRDLPAVHDGPAKLAITSLVDILDPQVKKIKNLLIYWLQHR